MSVLLQVFAVALWIALAYWTYQDARRRIAGPHWIAASAALAFFVPFLGPVLYLVLRPPEYLEDARERELELAELEHRVAQFGERRSREEIDRLLAGEGEAADAALEAALRRVGALTRADLADLDLRISELEFALRALDGRPSPLGRPAIEPAAEPAPAPEPVEEAGVPAPAEPPPAPARSARSGRSGRSRSRVGADDLELSRAERRAKLGLPPLESDLERAAAEPGADKKPTLFDGSAQHESGETGRAPRPTRASRPRRLSDPDPGSPYD